MCYLWLCLIPLQITADISVVQFWVGIAVVLATVVSTAFFIGMAFKGKANVDDVDEILKEKDEELKKLLKEKVDLTLYKQHCQDNNDKFKQITENQAKHLERITDLLDSLVEQNTITNSKIEGLAVHVEWIKREFDKKY